MYYELKNYRESKSYGVIIMFKEIAQKSINRYKERGIRKSSFFSFSNSILVHIFNKRVGKIKFICHNLKNLVYLMKYLMHQGGKLVTMIYIDLFHLMKSLRNMVLLGSYSYFVYRRWMSKENWRSRIQMNLTVFKSACKL